MARQLRKLYFVFSLYFCELMAYPAASVIWVIADTQVALILPCVWLAAAGPGGKVGDLTGGEMVTYYLVSSLIAQFVTCHLMWDMAEDVREGYLSTMLLRPLDHYQINIARNLAWRLGKLLLYLPVALIIFPVYAHVTHLAPVQFSWLGVLAVVLAQSLSYAVAYCVAQTAMWTTEYISTLRLFYFPEAFLSGRLLPLSTLPLWAQGMGHFLHFRYTIAFPVDIFMGRLSEAEIGGGLVLQVVWTAAFYVLGRVVFRRGLRRYTAVGM